MRNLRYFEQVARGGSIRKAADRLHIAASAISRSIAQLEYELGVELFDRAARGMVLTPAGEIYLRYARSTLLDAERVRSELDSLRGLQSGHVRISSIEGMTADFIIQTIYEFRQKYPRILFELQVAASSAVTKSVRSREADIGITANTDTGAGVEIAERIEERLQAVMSPDHPLANSEISLFDLLSSGSIAIPDTNSAIREQLDAFCRRENLVLRPALVTNSISALRAFATAGGGIIFLPRLAFREDLAAGRLIGRRIDDEHMPTAVIDICIPAGWRLSLAAVTFLSFLQAQTRKLIESHELGDDGGEAPPQR